MWCVKSPYLHVLLLLHRGHCNETMGFKMKQGKRNERIPGYFENRASPAPPAYSHHVSGREGRRCEKHKSQDSPKRRDGKLRSDMKFGDCDSELGNRGVSPVAGVLCWSTNESTNQRTNEPTNQPYSLAPSFWLSVVKGSSLLQSTSPQKGINWRFFTSGPWPHQVPWSPL